MVNGSVLLTALLVWTVTIVVVNRPWTEHFLHVGVKVGSITLIGMAALMQLPKHLGLGGVCYLYISFTINIFSQQTITFIEWLQSHAHLTLAFFASAIVYVSVNKNKRRLFLAEVALKKQLKKTEMAERRKRLFLNAIGYDLKQPLRVSTVSRTT